MEKEHLAESVEQLQAQLSQADHVDSETLARLRALTSDIDRLLDENDETSPADLPPLSGGLRDLVLKFEAEYPQLSAAIGRVADSLAAMGI